MISKSQIIKRVCYTELVYERINKKLKTAFCQEEIESFILHFINETPEKDFEKKGKNIYITHPKSQIKITVNASTFRVITVNKG